jgi:hypothetical protein
MANQGGCMCGAVRFEITIELDTAAACHCGMCRKFSGGVFLAVRVPVDGMRFVSDSELNVFPSSDWAERGFCKTCGSSLFYRITVPGPMQGELHVGLGTLDDADGIPLTSEIYIDRKPDGYAFAGSTTKMTEAEVVAMFTDVG